MSLAFKFGSLLVRTLAKPIANYLKQSARDHERFRTVCIACAQRVHRFDMRLRLGLLRDPAVIERRIAQSVLEEEARKRSLEPPTARTEAEAVADEHREKKTIVEKTRAAGVPRIRPLSDAKAIETGANFISESFMFAVAGMVLVFEAWRSRRKENSRREDIDSRIEALEDDRKQLVSTVAELEKQLTDLGGNPSAKSLHQVLVQIAKLPEQGEQAAEDAEPSLWNRIVSLVPARPWTPSTPLTEENDGKTDRVTVADGKQ